MSVQFFLGTVFGLVRRFQIHDDLLCCGSHALDVAGGKPLQIDRNRSLARSQSGNKGNAADL